MAEGVKIRWLSVVDHFGADGIVIEKVTMNADGSVTPTGETEKLAADSVVLAVGEHSDLSLLRGATGVSITRHGTVAVDEHMMTGHPGLFAGGDAIGGARTMMVPEPSGLPLPVGSLGEPLAPSRFTVRP
jgi:NADPH-dependent glutamate synthase beta subunit-like oxidoreductase